MRTITEAAYEGDIIDRLRNWRGLHLAHSGKMFEESAAEIVRLRGDSEVARLRLQAAHAESDLLRAAIRRLAEQDATLSVSGGTVTVTMDGTLTDEEREAVGAMAMYAESRPGAFNHGIVPTLRSLLERLG